MKPAWDQLAEDFMGSSVVVADVDCTVDNDLCGEHGVSGYPTIKYFTQETGKEGSSYNGGRSLEALTEFVNENLHTPCSVDDANTCSEKENTYITKMRASSGDERAAQIERLEGMLEKKATADLMKWMRQRISILKQL